ncbi:MAG: 1-acyl-sn-glycerol-3-phosphate acyltransferase [Halioglobus sp.]|nr:1-acyl-sn-glycerol-3-phosphate acyltransferase [Halioglobus sp.]
MTEQGDRHAASDPYTILQDAAFLGELAEIASREGKSREQAEKYARKCLTEIAAIPRTSWLAPAARLARFVYTRSYHPELDINLETMERIRELSRDQLLLFMWSHKSHMDSFVFLLSLYDNQFRPLPLVFAGVNMNFAGFGALARRVGAIFLRRDFQDDAIYRLVFRHYIDHLIRNRRSLTWSIEGTRSRTGKLSPPKLGILNWVLEACERQQVKDVKLVPVSIAFDRIAEVDDYVAWQRGLPKRKESLLWFFHYIFGMKKPYGKIYIRFAEPFAPDEVPEGAVQADSDETPSRTMRLAFEVCSRIEQVTPIKAADVLTMVLLAANGRALTIVELFQQASQISQLARERELPLATGFDLADEEKVAAALLSMRRSKLIQEFGKGSAPVYFVPEGQQLAAAYYRNTITHHFLYAGLGEMALALSIEDIRYTGEEEIAQRLNQLRDFFKFDLLFPPQGELIQKTIAELHSRYPEWNKRTASIPAQLRLAPPRFGHATLRSLAEAYYVVAVTLRGRGASPIPERKAFTTSLLERGREMLLRKQISTESALSRDLFDTALSLAEHRRLLVGNTDELAERRELFAREALEILVAVNLLQSAYDAAWFPPLGVAAQRGEQQ